MCDRQETPKTGEGPVYEGAERAARSYEAAASFLRCKLSRDDPAALADLQEVEAADVLVVPGSFDHVEQVLDALQVPYTLIAPDDLPRLSLRPEQLLIVNCPGRVPEPAIHQVRRFVEQGGSLFTTDWALRHLLEPAFPGILAYNERPTADDVVRIEINDHDNPFILGVQELGSDPLWWLEGSSFPIRILAPELVHVLISSRELAEKYGEGAVAVLFECGAGEVLHMISHYYLQRSQLRTARHAKSAACFAAELDIDLPAGQDIAGLALGDVESAYSSLRLMQNVILRRKSGARTETHPEDRGQSTAQHYGPRERPKR